MNIKELEGLSLAEKLKEFKRARGEYRAAVTRYQEQIKAGKWTGDVDKEIRPLSQAFTNAEEVCRKAWNEIMFSDKVAFRLEFEFLDE